MVAGAPALELGAVALTAQAIGLFKRYGPAVRQMEYIAIVRAMAVQTPAILRIMIENNLGMENQLPSSRINIEAFDVTLRTREDAFGERWWRHGDQFRRRIRSISRRGRISCTGYGVNRGQSEQRSSPEINQGQRNGFHGIESGGIRTAVVPTRWLVAAPELTRGGGIRVGNAGDSKKRAIRGGCDVR